MDNPNQTTREPTPPYRDTANLPFTHKEPVPHPMGLSVPWDQIPENEELPNTSWHDHFRLNYYRRLPVKEGHVDFPVTSSQYHNSGEGGMFVQLVVIEPDDSNNQGTNLMVCCGGSGASIRYNESLIGATRIQVSQPRLFTGQTPPPRVVDESLSTRKTRKLLFPNMDVPSFEVMHFEFDRFVKKWYFEQGITAETEILKGFDTLDFSFLDDESGAVWFEADHYILKQLGETEQRLLHAWKKHLHQDDALNDLYMRYEYQSTDCVMVTTLGSTGWSGYNDEKGDYWKCTEADLTPSGAQLLKAIRQCYPFFEIYLVTWLDT